MGNDKAATILSRPPPPASEADITNQSERSAAVLPGASRILLTSVPASGTH